MSTIDYLGRDIQQQEWARLRIGQVATVNTVSRSCTVNLPGAAMTGVTYAGAAPQVGDTAYCIAQGTSMVALGFSSSGGGWTIVANQAALPASAPTGAIYFTEDKNDLYRWSGSAWVYVGNTGGVIVNNYSAVLAIPNPPEGMLATTADHGITFRRSDAVWTPPVGAWATAGLADRSGMASQTYTQLVLTFQQMMPDCLFKKSADNLWITTDIAGPVRVIANVSVNGIPSGGYTVVRTVAFRGAAEIASAEGIASPGTFAWVTVPLLTPTWLLLAGDKLGVQAWVSAAGGGINASRSIFTIERLAGPNTYVNMTT